MNRIPNKPVALVCLWIILGIITISACGQAAPTKSNQTDGTGNVTITFADLQFGQEINAQQLADAFHQKNPTISVNVIPVDHSVQLSDEDIAKQADVIFLNGYNPASLPGFISLQPLVDEVADVNLKDLLSGSTTACSDAQGNLFGVPLILFLQGIYYDPKLFDRVHLAYPQSGWTWSQFRQVVTEVASSDGATVYGFVDGRDGFILYPLIMQQLLSNNGTVDSKAISASITWYQQLSKDKKLYPMQLAVNGIYPSAEINSLLANEQAAMWISSPVLENSRLNGPRAIYQPFPADQPEERTTPANVFCGGISAGSKSPQAAFEWLDFLSHQDLSGNKESGMLPARQSLVQTSPYFAGLAGSEKRAIQYALAHTWFDTPGQEATVYNVLQAVTSAVQSGTDLTIALQAIADQGNSAQPTATTKPVLVNTPKPTSPPNILTISFDVGGGIGTKWGGWGVGPTKFALDALIAEFEKANPGILVNVNVGAGQWNALSDQAKENDCMEGFQPFGYDTLPNADLLDLTSFLEASPSMKEDLQTAYLLPYTFDNKIYGIPADVDVQFVTYNEDLLTKLGLSFPDSGWTFDDMMALAAKAANPLSSPQIYGVASTDRFLIDAMGIRWYDNTVQPPKALFDTEAVTKNLAWLRRLYVNGTFLPDYGTALENVGQAIMDGRVAMWITNGLDAYDRNMTVYNENLPFKVGYVPLPSLAAGDSMSYLSISVGYFISAHTTPVKAKACWDFIQFLSDRPTIWGGYTPRKSLLEKEFTSANEDLLITVQTGIQEYHSYPFADQYDMLMHPYSEEWSDAKLAILQGEDPATVLTKAQKQADDYWACVSQKNITGLNQIQIFNRAVKGCYVESAGNFVLPPDSP